MLIILHYFRYKILCYTMLQSQILVKTVIRLIIDNYELIDNYYSVQ